MGNELSHQEGVKGSVGGTGNSGTFHKVLVDSEYSFPDLVHPVLNDPPDVSAKITDEVIYESTVDPEANPELTETESKGTEEKETKQKNEVDEEDDEVFEKCKALITEAAERAVKRSIGGSVSRNSQSELVTDIDAAEVEDSTETVQVLEQTSKTEVTTLESVVALYSDIEASEEKAAIDKVTESELNKGVEIKDETGTNVNVDTSKVEGKIKKGKGKSKKIKGKVDDTIKTSRKSEKRGSKTNVFSNMFKFSKKKSSGSDVVVADMNGKEATDVIESTCVKENGDSSNLTTCSSLNNSPDLEHDVKRLNSLDSGIVVEKGCDNPVANVEYAIPQKKEIKQHDENSDRETVNGKIEANESDDDLGKVIGQRLAEPIYINGDKDDEDFVYINERAVDVGNLSKSECSIVEAVENGPDGINYSSIGNDQAAKEDSKSNASSDSGTGMNSKIQYVDKPENPTGAKLKKKSWSFQFGRKKSTDREKTTANKDHDEVDGSPKEHKKQKWRFGKFSLKKSSEITASTPNLNKPSLPDETIAEEEEEKKEEPVGIRQKKRKSSAFQMIKARISRTFSDAGARERLDRRSHSLADLSTSDDTANKRRSIVESEPDLPDSEAFDGVSLSDMSNDEDVATPNEDKQASPKPAKRRKKATKTAKAAKTAKTTLEPNEQDKTKQTSSNGTSSNIMISSVENTNAANIELELEEKIENPIVEIKTNTIPKIKIVTEQSDGTYKELAKDDEYVKIAETALLTTSVKPIIADTKTVEPVCDDYSNVCKRPNEHNSMCEQISTESKAFDYVQQILTNAIDILKAENLTEPRSEIVGEDAVNEPEIKPETKASVKADLLLHTVLSKEQPNSDSSEDKINDIHVELVSSANSEQGVFTDEATVVKQSTCEELNKGISSNGSNAEEVQLSLKENRALFERVVCRKERSISIDEEPDTKERAMSFEEEAKYVSELNVTLNSTPSTPTTDMAMRLEVNVGKDINIPAGKKIVLMKEMAVQVPDDSVPLDLEKDLGFTDHVACTVSVGVQAGSS